jgi:DNA-binding NtrC family response regulator
MVVRKLDELIDLVVKGYKPYYHRGVNRWYLRRGSKRILIDRSLDSVVEEIHKLLEELKRLREAVRRELLRKAIMLRASGLTVNEVIEITGVPRSTLYRHL